MTDLFELALIAVVVSAGYWGVFFVRRQPHGTPLFGLMQLGAAVLAALGLVGRHGDAEWLGVAGAIGVGAGACLLVLGPLVRGAARWCAQTERYGVAARLLDVAELLAPGAGASDEKALLAALREIRDGKIEHTVDALTAAKQRAPDDARLAIDERIAMLYLAAYRWSDAIAHAEANLFGAIADDSAPAAPHLALRRALGVAPPVWVELLGAYGRTGDLDRAARMLARLEDACAGRADAALWVHRARLMFLALAGRVEAVQVLVEPRRSRHMNAASRTYWLGVAHERKGDGAAAELAYAKARARSRGRPRELIDLALATLADARPVELSPAAADVITRVEAAPVPDVARPDRHRGPWATRALVAAMVIAATAIVLAFGESSDVGVLMRAGALIRNFAGAGEWWRLVACIFVHVGAVHLVVNTIGLAIIGRLAEELFGGARTVAIFALAGLAGAAASFEVAPVGAAAGSSGAIFGLLGAVFVEMVWHRVRHRAVRERGVMILVAVATIALAGIGLVDPGIDLWAHGAGFAAGVIAGTALSPQARWHRVARQLARVVAVAFAIVVAVAAVHVARTSSADSLDALPHGRRAVAGVSVDVPATWELALDELSDRDLFVVFAPQRVPDALAPALAAATAREPASVRRDRHFDRVDPADGTLVPLPAGWQGSELAASVADALGNRQHYRVVVAGTVVGNATVIARLYVPESVARAAPEFFTNVFASLRAP